MDKENLWALCEKFVNLEHHINDLGIQLQHLSSELLDVKNCITEVIEEDQKSCAEVKMVITEVYGNVESPAGENEDQSKETIIASDNNTEKGHVSAEDTEKSEVPKANFPESDGEVAVSKGTPVEIRYCSMALSNDFEFSDTEVTRSIRSIYVIEVMNDTEARYYPIAEKAQQLMMRRAELVDPICITGRYLDLGDFCVAEDKYGLLKRNIYGRWDIVKKCSLI